MIVVVSGLPRSGTSLVMQMLHAGGFPVLMDQRRAPDDDNPRGYFEDERVKKLARDASWLREAEGRAVKVVSPLLRHLPSGFEYRVIFVERDLSEVVQSQQKMLTRRGERGAGVPPERLKAAYARHIEEVFESLAARKNMVVLRLSYREIIAEPLMSAQRIRGFVGAAMDIDAMARVVDPNLYRQRGHGDVSS